EHRLAGEEVPEAKRDVQIRIRQLLVRELDVAADRLRPDLARPAVGGLHQTGAAAGDDGPAAAAEASAHLADQRVVGVIARRARGAEDGDGAPDPGQRVEAACELL